ncbi:hypothetical protein D7X96_20340 [Corallococcus interemptor]|uniref:Uncharacterized protein n=2 Tax=Corallococcus interemptor TaxID=2316720 RepID=A0A3A8QEA5_9BACT|nr:hypothetical protein D7X96_20340 [Corallococcus interemptor]
MAMENSTRHDVTGPVKNPATGKEEVKVLFVCQPCRVAIGGWRESEKFVQDYYAKHYAGRG